MENLDNSVAALPKKRGRKPGSKNKVSTKRTSKKVSYLSAFSILEQEIQSLSNALKKATLKAEKEIEKLEKKQSREGKGQSSEVIVVVESPRKSQFEKRQSEHRS
jgi:hypothetical protein